MTYLLFQSPIIPPHRPFTGPKLVHSIPQTHTALSLCSLFSGLGCLIPISASWDPSHSSSSSSKYLLHVPTTPELDQTPHSFAFPQHVLTFPSGVHPHVSPFLTEYKIINSV